MTRTDVITRLKLVEPALRARGVGALYLFGSHGRDEAGPESDVDVFVEAGSDGFYDLGNCMGAYGDLRDAFPGAEIGYSTRDGLSDRVRSTVERDAVRIF